MRTTAHSRTRRGGTIFGVAITLATTASMLAMAIAIAAPARVHLSGRLAAAHGDDFARGSSTATTYLLTDRAGVVSEVRFSHQPAAALLGRHVEVDGSTLGGNVVAADGASASADTTVSSTASTGAHRVAVVLLNFANDSSQPYTPAYAGGVAFLNTNSVAAYYAQTSWGQLSLSGSVFGWYTLPDTNATCAYSTWATDANAAVAASGVDLSTFDNVVYAFPNVSACAWAGLGEMPGRNSWLNGPSAMALRVMAHELGHNFGTHHAGEYKCVENGIQVPLSANTANCTAGEYGDPLSVMGSATHYEHTNFARGNFGWLAPANTQTVTTSGDYALQPVETHTSTAVTALRVARTSSSSFTLEFRQGDGSPFDTFSPTSTVANGLILRLTAPSYATRQQTWLVWAHPAAIFCECNAPLGVGQSLFDPVSGITFTLLSAGSAGAVVRVAFGSAGLPPGPTGTPTPTPTPTPMPTPMPTPTPTSTPGPTATTTPTPTLSPTPAPSLSAPSNLTASVSKARKVSLSWSAGSGNVAVAGYRIYRNGVVVATTSGLKWNDSLALNGLRTYYVVAFDAGGHLSPPSNQVTVQ